MEILSWGMVVLVVIGSTFILGELLAYAWHRWIAHGPKGIILETHKLHHRNPEHHSYVPTGDEDFFWIVALVPFLWLIGLTVAKFLPISIWWILLVLFTLSFTLFYNWFLHDAYHQENHFLLKYSWFRNLHRWHFLHHEDHKVNYGITTDLGDVLFGTFRSISFL